MRSLTEPETQTLLKKLADYMSLDSLKGPLSNVDESERYVFRLHRDRIYYMKLSLANLATSVARSNLLSVGICVGKLTKAGKVRLFITALPLLSEGARYKLWVKSNAEMPVLYGGHVVKAHVGRVNEDTAEHQGVVIYNMNDIPLGFGVTARSAAESRRLDPTAIVCFRQADCGEYLRDEDNLFASG
ncbi:60S ribosome subunit biogenesis protein NIP7 [Xylogone sp. PMI_703]|nr:60S ribosome subunit biogenesis protein NIP7 [Xylogone sp. PMI_703]